MNVNKELVNNVIDAIIDFVGACTNDVCTDANENEYIIFDGSVKADKDGNIKTYSHSGELVGQVPVRPILTNLKKLGHNMVDLIEDHEKKREAAAAEAAAAEAAAAEAAAAEAANKDVDDKIKALESEISNLKLQKKPVRRFVKKLSFD